MLRAVYRTKELGPAPDEGQFGQPLFRFTIVYALIILVLTTMPIWLSFITPSYVAVVSSLFMGGFLAIWFSIGCNAIWNFSLMESAPLVPINGVSIARKRQFVHTIIVPCYLDPIDVLFDCIGSLMLQDNPDRLLVVVAFETKTPDLDSKMQAVRVAFHDKFGGFLITVHTVDRSKEIAGGCSNKNYALHKAYDFLARHKLLDANAVTITTCDTDSLFHPNYFRTLETCYNCSNPLPETEQPLKMCVWQPPLFYNWDLDERPFFNRITGLMRSMMMLGGLISFNLNPMSIFSYPIELGLSAGFINPRYGVDDIIAKVRWMCSTNSAVPVLLLPVPVISGPTIGTSFWIEVEEWARQIRRWIVGSSESFHYFVIHYRGQPLFSGLWWFFMFFMYYAVLLCSAGIFTFLAGLPLSWVEYPSFNIGGGFSFSLQNSSLAALVLQYLVFAIAFVIDRRAVRMMGIKENIGICRNMLHWLLAPPTLLCYSVVAFYAIIRFVFVGKKMARHDMAAKEGLGANTQAGIVKQEEHLTSAVTAAIHENERSGEEALLPPSYISGVDDDAYEPVAEDAPPRAHRSTSISRARGRHNSSSTNSRSSSRAHSNCSAQLGRDQKLPLTESLLKDLSSTGKEQQHWSAPHGGVAKDREDDSHAQHSDNIDVGEKAELLCELPDSFSFGGFTLHRKDFKICQPLAAADRA